MMNRFFANSLALFLLGGCGDAQRAPEVRVSHAWLRMPASPDGAGAGYFEAEADRAGEVLVAVSVPAARAEMHESMTMNRMSAMRPLARAAFDGEQLSFAPGGKHLMIFGLDPKLKPGTSVPLTLRFRSAPPVTVPAILVAAGQPGPGDDG